MLDEYKFTFTSPGRQWNEVIPLELIRCPACGRTGMVKDGVDPRGTFFWALCACGEVSKVSG